jgi:phosphoserine phosphatase
MAELFPHVLNVIAAHRDAAERAAEIRAAVASTGAAGEIDWLAPFHAFDIPFLGDPKKTLVAARAAAAGAPLDINAIAAEGRRKRLLVADMDSTIINCECLDELADMAGLKPRIAAITARAMNGEIEFAAALRERVALLEGLKLDALERVYRERIHLNPGAKALVATMRADGARTMLVSGGFTFFTSRVAKDAGFEIQQANRLIDDGLALTGRVREPVLGREAKLEALERAVADMQISLDDTLAIGDGANDLDMIKRAGLGIAYHAKPIVAEAAGARIDHGDLTAVLYLQGYRESEIFSDDQPSTARPRRNSTQRHKGHKGK